MTDWLLCLIRFMTEVIAFSSQCFSDATDSWKRFTLLLWCSRILENLHYFSDATDSWKRSTLLLWCNRFLEEVYCTSLMQQILGRSTLLLWCNRFLEEVYITSLMQQIHERSLHYFLDATDSQKNHAAEEEVNVSAFVMHNLFTLYVHAAINQYLKEDLLCVQC